MKIIQNRISSSSAPSHCRCLSLSYLCTVLRANENADAMQPTRCLKCNASMRFEIPSLLKIQMHRILFVILWKKYIDVIGVLLTLESNRARWKRASDPNLDALQAVSRGCGGQRPTANGQRLMLTVLAQIRRALRAAV